MPQRTLEERSSQNITTMLELIEVSSAYLRLQAQVER